MGYINPHRKIENTVLLYTEHEGGDVKCLFGVNKKYYKQVIHDGFIKIKTGDREPNPIMIKYVAFANIIDGYDFVLKDINNANLILEKIRRNKKQKK